MPLQADLRLSAASLRPRLWRLFELSAGKIRRLERTWNPADGAPVFTRRGRYVSRGWTEWTQGFQFGAALLQFEATGERTFLDLGRRLTLDRMAPHLTHLGVHDHGFNHVSTYGVLRRLVLTGRAPDLEHELPLYELALKVSGAVQAARWTRLAPGQGYIYSFNGPHSLFVDTIRSLRVLALGHQLGHVLLGERDRRISLLARWLQHATTTARYSVFYGEGRDACDVRGRTAHECLFNVTDGSYRCPSTQQGWSPFTTWTRGLAWALLGFAEVLEVTGTLKEADWETAIRSDPGWPEGPAVAVPPSTLGAFRTLCFRAARATADFYLAHTCTDGVPMWDTGAPNLHRLGDYLERPSDPFNEWEPVDASAAAIAAQGLLRLARLESRREAAGRYRQAGLTVARTLLEPPYLSTRPAHQGLLLHSVYHRPNGWDYRAPGQKIPNGESSMWGDYHLRELGVLLLQDGVAEADEEP